jgi:hypothetical protein
MPPARSCLRVFALCSNLLGGHKVRSQILDLGLGRRRAVLLFEFEELLEEPLGFLCKSRQTPNQLKQ